jgi:hypothetical protein
MTPLGLAQADPRFSLRPRGRRRPRGPPASRRSWRVANRELPFSRASPGAGSLVRVNQGAPMLLRRGTRRGEPGPASRPPFADAKSMVGPCGGGRVVIGTSSRRTPGAHSFRTRAASTGGRGVLRLLVRPARVRRSALCEELEGVHSRRRVRLGRTPSFRSNRVRSRGRPSWSGSPESPPGAVRDRFRRLVPRWRDTHHPSRARRNPSLGPHLVPSLRPIS